MAKIEAANPVVELDRDEMARVMWSFIKNKLILSYLDIDLNIIALAWRTAMPSPHCDNTVRNRR